MDRVLGLDSGGSKTEAVVINRAGRVLARVGRRVWGCWQQNSGRCLARFWGCPVMARLRRFRHDRWWSLICLAHKPR